MQNELIYVYTVWKEGSFSKAAARLFLTQPALSLAIQRIESSIGMPLFDRSKRPLRLTAVGEAYIASIQKMRQLEQDLAREIDDIQNLKRGTLHLGGTNYINAYIVAPMLAGFHRAYPGIQLELEEQGAAQINQLLVDHKIDLAFSCSTSFAGDYPTFPAFQDRVLLAVPEQDPVNQRYRDARMTAADVWAGRHLDDAVPALSPRCFQDLEYILLRPGNNLYERCQQLFSDFQIKPRVTMTISQLATAEMLAEQGMGAAFVCDRLVRKDSRRLYFYKLDSPLMDRSFYMVLPRSSYTPHSVRRFIQYFQENVPRRVPAGDEDAARQPKPV